MPKKNSKNIKNMNRICSPALKAEVLEYLERGGSKVDASRIFQVSRQTIYNWLALKKQSGGYF